MRRGSDLELLSFVFEHSRKYELRLHYCSLGGSNAIFLGELSSPRWCSSPAQLSSFRIEIWYFKTERCLHQELGIIDCKKDFGFSNRQRVHQCSVPFGETIDRERRNVIEPSP